MAQQQPLNQPNRLAEVIELAKHFETYEEARRAIARLGAEDRAAALRRALGIGADSRSVVVAALIVHTEPHLLDHLHKHER